MATLNITTENHDQTIADNGIVILDFWASWCGPCRAFGPTFEASSEKHGDIVHGKIDTEAQRELAARYGIRSIPSIVFYREQIPVHMQAGALPPAALEDMITQLRELDMDQVRAAIEADGQ